MTLDAKPAATGSASTKSAGSQSVRSGSAASGSADTRRRWPRRVAVGGATAVAVAAASTAAGGWYYADELLLVRPEPPEYPIEVVAVSRSSVTLSGEGAGEPGILGLEWADGYARVNPHVQVTDGLATRGLVGYPQVPAVGTKVRMDGYAAPADLAAFAKTTGFEVEEVEFSGPLGRYPATLIPAEPAAPAEPAEPSTGVPAEPSTGVPVEPSAGVPAEPVVSGSANPQAGPERWIIHVHGRGAGRAEAYRLVPVLNQLGFSQLSISYRNDADAPADPDGEYGLGWTESEDLAAAVAEAKRRGADDVVLIGYSMGAAVVGNYLRTHGSDDVAGVVYDSPALSWPDILAFQAKDRGLPGFSGTIAAAVVRVRTGIELGTMDQVAHAGDLDVPVLLAHGTADLTIPVASSDAFAEARPDLVTYLRTEAGHVRNWNVDPQRYEAALRDFLTGLPQPLP